MKNILFIKIILLFAILGCNRDIKNEGKQALSSELDTFYLGKRLVSIAKIDSLEFIKTSEKFLDTSEAKNLLKDSLLVRRNKDTLFFKTSKGWKTLVNDTSDNEMFSKYRYRGFSSELGQFITYGVFYEWDNYLLVDSETGDTTYISSYPLVSADKKMFICGNSSLFSEENFNGIELYSNSHKPVLIGLRYLDKWGPKSIKWLNSNTLVAKVDVRDTTKEYAQKRQYFKLKIE